MLPQDITKALSAALKDNECARVKELITNCADVNQANAEGMRLLQYAAETGCMRCLALLLNHGADIEATATMNAPSAVSIAASNGHLDALKYLLNNCVDESVTNGAKKSNRHCITLVSTARSMLCTTSLRSTVNIAFSEFRI